MATIVIAIASQIMDQIPSLRAIHAFLPTHGWLAFTGLFRFPVDWAPMRGGLLVSARLHGGVPHPRARGLPTPRRDELTPGAAPDRAPSLSRRL